MIYLFPWDQCDRKCVCMGKGLVNISWGCRMCQEPEQRPGLRSRPQLRTLRNRPLKSMRRASYIIKTPEKESQRLDKGLSRQVLGAGGTIQDTSDHGDSNLLKRVPYFWPRKILPSEEQGLSHALYPLWSDAEQQRASLSQSLEDLCRQTDA